MVKNKDSDHSYLALFLVLLVAYSLLLLLFFYETKAYAVKQAEMQIEAVLLNYRAIRTYVRENQKPEVRRLKGAGRLYQDYFSPELLSASFAAHTVMKYANQERINSHLPPFYFKLASSNPRNPLNQADALESKLLRQMNEGTISDYKEVTDIDGVPYLFVALSTGKMDGRCMECHSEPNRAPSELLNYYDDRAGFFEEEGDIRALLSIRVPLESYLAEGSRVAIGLSLATTVIFASICFLIWFFSRRLSTSNAILERTNVELSSAMNDLKQTQSQLVETEKLASLGRLVAGFAHEVNTPMGVAVGAASHIQESVLAIQQMMEQEEVDEGELLQLLDGVNEGSRLTLANLQRAAGLVSSFKRTSVDQISEDDRLFNIKEAIGDVLNSLHNKFKRTSIHIKVDCPDNLNLYGVPGVLDQILTNLLINSLKYGFGGGGDDGNISIQLSLEGRHLTIEYRDDGRGMEKEVRDKAFEPFFTTGRSSGGSGLGLYICYNLATQRLGGSITLDSAPGMGVHIVIRYPVTLQKG